jgi:hypothetical protein
VRPSTIVSLVTAAVVAVVAAICAVLAFVSRAPGRAWFYWIAPLLAIGFAGVMANLVVTYWVKLGRLETKGRPRK